MKIGQFFIIGFEGKEVPHFVEKLILEEDLLGVILFSRNFSNPMQIKLLINTLNQLKAKVSDKPLIIGIDSEGGWVNRFNQIINPLPSALSQGLYGKTIITENLYSYNAFQLSKLGINCNFAPVCDVLPQDLNSAIGIRSFYSNPDKVSKFIKSAIKGMQQAGIVACCKHFPGLGKVTLDTHFELPVLNSKACKLKHDLLPFKAGIDGGACLMMTSHCIYTAYDKNLSTFSVKINTLLLRQTLKFKGVLISDDLRMGAIAKKWTLLESVLNALKVGVDAVMVGHKSDEIHSIISPLKKKLAALPHDYFKERKRRFAWLYDRFFETNKRRGKKYSKEKFDDISLKIAKKTLCWHKKKSVKFNKKEKIDIIMPPLYPSYGVDEQNKATLFFQKKLKVLFPKLNTIQLDQNWSGEFNSGNNHNTILILGHINSMRELEKHLGKILTGERKIDLAIFAKNPVLKPLNVMKYFKNVCFTYGFNKTNQLSLIDFIVEKFYV